MMEKQAKYTGDRLMAAINAFRNSHLTKTKTVLLFDDISKNVLDRHKRIYADAGPDELPILAVNALKMAMTGLTNSTGLLITDQFLYFKCLKDKSYSEMTGATLKGKIPLSDIVEVRADNNVEASHRSGEYINLTVNGNKIGSLLLEVGMFTPIDDVSDELNWIFRATENGVKVVSPTNASKKFRKKVDACAKADKAVAVVGYIISLIPALILGSIAALAEWSGWIIGLLFFVGYGIGWIISALLERKIKRFFYSKFVGDAIG